MYGIHIRMICMYYMISVMCTCVLTNLRFCFECHDDRNSCAYTFKYTYLQYVHRSMGVPMQALKPAAIKHKSWYVHWYVYLFVNQICLFIYLYILPIYLFSMLCICNLCINLFAYNLSIHQSTQLSTYLSQSSYCYSGQLPSWEWRWCRPLQGLPSQVVHVAPRYCTYPGVFPKAYLSSIEVLQLPRNHRASTSRDAMKHTRLDERSPESTQILPAVWPSAAQGWQNGKAQVFLVGSSSCCCHTFIKTYVFLY